MTIEIVEIQTGVYGEFTRISADWDPEYQYGSLRDNSAIWGREQYGVICVAAGVEARADGEINECAYGLKYAEFDMPTWRERMTRAQRVGHILAGRRLAGIEAEWKAAARPATVKMVLCNCGHTVPLGEVMNASNGSSCEGCYDQMSY